MSVIGSLETGVGLESASDQVGASVVGDEEEGALPVGLGGHRVPAPDGVDPVGVPFGSRRLRGGGGACGMRGSGVASRDF